MNTEEAMIGSTPAGLPVRGVQRSAALLSLTAAWFALALFAALHLLKPELDPSWRLASEYAIGRHRWIMALTFLALAISCASLVVAIHPQVQTVGGRIGSRSIAGRCHLDGRWQRSFQSHPITAGRDAVTTHGSLHGLASMIGIPGFPVAALLVSWSLSRNLAWVSWRRLPLGSAAIDLGSRWF